MSSEPVSKELTGGGGASDYMIRVAGDMSEQHRGMDGSIAYNTQNGGGVGLVQALVPAGLVLANTKLPKMLRNSGLSKMNKGGEGNLIEEPTGGNLAQIFIPSTMLTRQTYMVNTKSKTKRNMKKRLMNKSKRSRSIKHHTKSKRRNGRKH